MHQARIYPLSKSSTQSGKSRAGAWVLEHEPAEQKRLDPLTGWFGSGDVDNQVRLSFPTKEAAVAYAEAKGMDYTVGSQSERKLIVQAYADNFR